MRGRVSHLRPELSIVVCVYDTEESYLKECLGSIVRSDLSDYEIVIADDGSHKDYSALLAAFPAVRYLKLEHRGLSAARVAGAQSAEGKYIAFADSDDKVSFSYYSRLLEAMRRGRDVAVGGWACLTENSIYRFSLDGTMRKPRVLTENVYDFFFERAGREHSRYVAWNKMFAADLLKGAVGEMKACLPDFPLGYAEDVLLSHFALRRANSLEVVQGGWYFYRLHGGQMVRADTAEKLADNLRCACFVFDEIEKSPLCERRAKALRAWRALLAKDFCARAEKVSPELLREAEAFGHGRAARRGFVSTVHALFPDNLFEYDELLHEIAVQGGGTLSGGGCAYFEQELARLQKERGITAERVKRDGVFSVPAPKISLKNRLRHNKALCVAADVLFPPGGRARERLKLLW